jgi:hypothetical protein
MVAPSWAISGTPIIETRYLVRRHAGQLPIMGTRYLIRRHAGQDGW